MKPADHAKFEGYLAKWTYVECLLGCVLFTDLLIPCAISSKCTQADELDILGALSNLQRTVKETNTLNTRHVDQCPNYAATLKKIADEMNKKSIKVRC